MLKVSNGTSGPGLRESGHETKTNNISQNATGL